MYSSCVAFNPALSHQNLKNPCYNHWRAAIKTCNLYLFWPILNFLTVVLKATTRISLYCCLEKARRLKKTLYVFVPFKNYINLLNNQKSKEVNGLLGNHKVTPRLSKGWDKSHLSPSNQAGLFLFVLKGQFTPKSLFALPNYTRQSQHFAEGSVHPVMRLRVTAWQDVSSLHASFRWRM